MEEDIATQEKKGMNTGLFVKHPLSGEHLQVWVANYVLMAYGEGAVMAVPTHDERDFEFARSYSLPIKQVITNNIETGRKRDNKYQDKKYDYYEFTLDEWREWYAEKDGEIKTFCVNSGKYDGLGYHDAVDSIATDLASQNLGQKKVQYRLRDWGISLSLIHI